MCALLIGRGLTQEAQALVIDEAIQSGAAVRAFPAH